MTDTLFEQAYDRYVGRWRVNHRQRDPNFWEYREKERKFGVGVTHLASKALKMAADTDHLDVFSITEGTERNMPGDEPAELNTLEIQAETKPFSYESRSYILTGHFKRGLQGDMKSGFLSYRDLLAVELQGVIKAYRPRLAVVRTEMMDVGALDRVLLIEDVISTSIAVAHPDLSEQLVGVAPETPDAEGLKKLFSAAGQLASYN